MCLMSTVLKIGEGWALLLRACKFVVVFVVTYAVRYGLDLGLGKILQPLLG